MPISSAYSAAVSARLRYAAPTWLSGMWLHETAQDHVARIAQGDQKSDFRKNADERRDQKGVGGIFVNQAAARQWVCPGTIPWRGNNYAGPAGAEQAWPLTSAACMAVSSGWLMQKRAVSIIVKYLGFLRRNDVRMRIQNLFQQGGARAGMPPSNASRWRGWSWPAESNHCCSRSAGAFAVR